VTVRSGTAYAASTATFRERAGVEAQDPCCAHPARSDRFALPWSAVLDRVEPATQTPSVRNPVPAARTLVQCRISLAPAALLVVVSRCRGGYGNERPGERACRTDRASDANPSSARSVAKVTS
jgi:hypothetical protein